MNAFSDILTSLFQNNTTTFIIFIVPEGIACFDCMYSLKQLFYGYECYLLDSIAQSLTKVTEVASLAVLHLFSLSLKVSPFPCFRLIYSALLTLSSGMSSVVQIYV